MFKKSSYGSLDSFMASIRQYGVASELQGNKIIVHVFMPDDLEVSYKYRRFLNNYMTEHQIFWDFVKYLEKELNATVSSDLPLIEQFTIFDGIPVHGRWIHAQLNFDQYNIDPNFDFDQICRDFGVFPANF